MSSVKLSMSMDIFSGLLAFGHPMFTGLTRVVVIEARQVGI